MGSGAKSRKMKRRAGQRKKKARDQKVRVAQVAARAKGVHLTRAEALGPALTPSSSKPKNWVCSHCNQQNMATDEQCRYWRCQQPAPWVAARTAGR